MASQYKASKQQTFVVAISPNLVEDVDNLYHLPPMFYTSRGDRVFVHGSPHVQSSNTEVVANFDVLITSSGDGLVSPTWEFAIDKNKVFRLPRYRKDVQHLMMNRFATENGLKGFVKIPTFFNKVGRIDLMNVRGYGLGNYHGIDRMVIKPVHGARGIHQFVVDTRTGNIHAFFQGLDKAINLYDKNAQDINEFLTQLREHYSGDFDYFKGKNNTFEGPGHLSQQIFFAQAYVGDVEQEIRIITGPNGEPTVAVGRERAKYDGDKFTYHQASGAGMSDNLLNLDSIPTTLTKLTPEYWEEVKVMCREVIGPLNSVDLFITKEGKWGIFEFCNQFGTTGIPNVVATDVHKQVIENLIYGE